MRLTSLALVTSSLVLSWSRGALAADFDDAGRFSFDASAAAELGFEGSVTDPEDDTKIVSAADPGALEGGSVLALEPFQGIDFNLEDDAIQIYSPQSAVQRQTGTLLIPRAKWFCFRAKVTIAQEDGTVDAYIDDGLALHYEMSATVKDPTIYGPEHVGKKWRVEVMSILKFRGDLVYYEADFHERSGRAKSLGIA